MNNTPAPEVQEQPSSSVAQDTPVATTQPTTPTPQKKSNKGLIALLVGLGVLGLALIIGLLVYFTMFYISKADYSHAATQTDKVIDSYNKASTAADDYIAVVEDAAATDSQISAKKAAYQASYSDYLNNVKTLSRQRAMKNDKVKAAYDKFAAKNDAFTQNNATMVPTMTTLHKIATNCSEEKVGKMDTSDLAVLVSKYDAAVGPCSDSMKELSTSKNSDLRATKLI